MKTKGILLFVFIIIPILYIKGQVTVGSNLPPEKAAILDIKSENGGAGEASSTHGGLLLPRVEIDTITNISIFPGISGMNNVEQKKRHTGLMVYNIKRDLDHNIEEGIYVWNGEKWEKSTYRSRVNFFYMPSIVVPTNVTGQEFEIDLYDEYQKQFKTPKIHNPSAPDTIPFFLKPKELYYYITDYDPTVFKTSSMSITDDGKFKYEVENAATTGSSFINIVFVIK